MIRSYLPSSTFTPVIQVTFSFILTLTLFIFLTLTLIILLDKLNIILDISSAMESVTLYNTCDPDLDMIGELEALINCRGATYI